MAEKSANADHKVAAVARKQHGVASIGQLRFAGLSDDAVLGRVRAGRLHRLHRGVYAVGHPALSSEGWWMAAVLACGGRDNALGRDGRSGGGETRTVLDFWGAALSFLSAAAHWGLLPAAGGPVDVTVCGDGGRARRRGVRLHRCTSLKPVDVTLHEGIPVTTPARTVADLRRVASGRGLISPKQLRRAIRQANVFGLPIGDEDRRDRTRSDLERAFLRLCRRHRLPAPEVNVFIGGHLVDFLWRERMLVVETDGYRYHRGRRAFEDDRGRDLELRSLGFEVIRISDRQVGEHPRQIAEVLAAALSGEAAPPPDL